MQFFKNISINLKATGPSAVLCTYIICITLIGMFGDGKFTGFVIGGLMGLGPILLSILGSSSDRNVN